MFSRFNIIGPADLLFSFHSVSQRSVRETILSREIQKLRLLFPRWRSWFLQTAKKTAREVERWILRQGEQGSSYSHARADSWSQSMGLCFRRWQGFHMRSGYWRRSCSQMLGLAFLMNAWFACCGRERSRLSAKTWRSRGFEIWGTFRISRPQWPRWGHSYRRAFCSSRWSLALWLSAPPWRYRVSECLSSHLKTGRDGRFSQSRPPKRSDQTEIGRWDLANTLRSDPPVGWSGASRVGALGEASCKTEATGWRPRSSWGLVGLRGLPEKLADWRLWERVISVLFRQSAQWSAWPPSAARARGGRPRKSVQGIPRSWKPETENSRRFREKPRHVKSPLPEAASGDRRQPPSFPYHIWGQVSWWSHPRWSSPSHWGARAPLWVSFGVEPWKSSHFDLDSSFRRMVDLWLSNYPVLYFLFLNSQYGDLWSAPGGKLIRHHWLDQAENIVKTCQVRFSPGVTEDALADSTTWDPFKITFKCKRRGQLSMYPIYLLFQQNYDDNQGHLFLFFSKQWKGKEEKWQEKTDRKRRGSLRLGLCIR